MVGQGGTENPGSAVQSRPRPTILSRGRGAGLNNRGFTMLELVSVLAVVGVLAVVATPLMASSFAQTSDRAVAEQLVTILNRGRQLAIARNTDVCVMVANHSTMYYLV